MKSKHITALLLTSFSLSISSCTHEDPEIKDTENQQNPTVPDDPNKEEFVSRIGDVFPGKKINSFYEYTFSYNDDGTLAAAKKSANDNYSFAYDGETVVMEACRPHYSAKYTFHIGKNGFADKCTHNSNTGYNSTITLTYDSNGHLIKYDEPRNSNYYMNFYIEGDNVVRVGTQTAETIMTLSYGNNLSHGLMILNVFFDSSFASSLDSL